MLLYVFSAALSILFLLLESGSQYRGKGVWNMLGSSGWVHSTSCLRLSSARKNPPSMDPILIILSNFVSKPSIPTPPRNSALAVWPDLMGAVLIPYYSGFQWVTASCSFWKADWLITHLLEIMACMGIPAWIETDNAPTYVSNKMKQSLHITI